MNFSWNIIYDELQITLFTQHEKSTNSQITMLHWPNSRLIVLSLLKCMVGMQNTLYLFEC